MLASMWIDHRGSEVLSRPECLQLLAVAAADGAIGRLALSTEGAPVVVPVNFAFGHGLVIVRVGEGYMWSAAKNRLVAFEVDALDIEPAKGTHMAWSVLVRGLATPLASEHLEEPQLPRPLVPLPGHNFLAIRPDVVSGRRFPLRSAQSSPQPAGSDREVGTSARTGSG